jgi:tetratricopeptide (TPR) repeat protein
MKRSWVFALMVLAPAVLAAQSRPSSTTHTNSAELYLSRVASARGDDERKDLLQKALEQALQGIKVKPDNPKAYLIAGRVHVLQGNALAADSMLDKAEQLWPEYAKETDALRFRVWATAYNAGIVAMRDNNFDEAMKQFEAATQVYDKRPGAHLNIAQIYARKQENDKAIEAYRAALQIMGKAENKQGLKPEEVKQWAELEENATFNVGQLLAASGKNEDALRAYQEYLARNPTNSMAKSNLAVVLTRMNRTEDAAKIYTELLAMDLSDIEFFNVGVGLYRAEQHAQAINAFRKALAKNPHMRDALYNLSQALYAETQALEEQKMKAKGAEVKPIDEKLNATYKELGEVAEKLRAIDPNNRNAIALQARAYRALADLTTDAAASTNWKNKTLEVLKANEALPFVVEGMTLNQNASEATLTGQVVNLKGKVGEPVKLRIHFLGRDGAALGTQEVTVSLGEVQGAAPFTATLKTATPVAGWKYEVVG